MVGAGPEEGTPETPRVPSHNCVQVERRTSVSFTVRSLSDTEIEAKRSLPARDSEETGETDTEKDLKTDCAKC